MPDDLRGTVLSRTDLVELIGQTVALRRTGKDYVGLCPFHQEKTPSFHVSPAKQFFYCYGCKAGGTAIDFVMKRDRVDFKGALEVLARRAGIDLPEAGRSGQKPGERQVLLDVHSAACRFFEKLLSDERQGLIAREYLAKRGFNQETIKKFQIGLALQAWDALLTSEVGRKFGPEVLASAGLAKVREKGGGFYDTFRNRVMFPIRDESGRIIAFGGRIMPGADDPAKYLNSPETLLFSKSRCIFGLDFGRQRIVETRTVAIVEGYTDAVMAHQYGVTNVVSVLGTAMTEQHVTVLRRFADKIVLLFDADTAGDLAVGRVVQLFLTQPVEIIVASMPSGMDPDEYLLAHGAEGFEQMLAGGTDALTYAWRQLSRRFNSSQDLTGQQRAAREYLDLLAGARGSGPIDAMRWGAALARVARLTDIPVEELHRRFRMQRRPGPAAVPQTAAHAVEPMAAAEAQIEEIEPQLPMAQEFAERRLLGALLMEPGRWQAVQAHVSVNDFASLRRRRLAELYWEHQRHEGEPVFSEFLAMLPEDLKAVAVELVEEVGSLPDVNVVVDDGIKHLADLRRRREEHRVVSEARQSNELSPEAQNDALRKVMEAVRQPDVRRVGM